MKAKNHSQKEVDNRREQRNANARRRYAEQKKTNNTHYQRNSKYRKKQNEANRSRYHTDQDYRERKKASCRENIKKRREKKKANYINKKAEDEKRGIKRKRNEDENGNNKKFRRTKNFDEIISTELSINEISPTSEEKNPKVDLELSGDNFNQKKRPNKESIDLNDENLFLPEPTSVQRYYIRRTGRNGDFQQLLARFPELSYVLQPVGYWNGKTCNQEADIYIAPIAALGEGAYGVFSSRTIKYDPENPQFLSYYMGERKIICKKDQSQYLHEVELTNDEMEKMKKNGITMGPDDKFGIDAEKNSVNWTRFLNNNPDDPNTYIEEVVQITEDGKISELIIRTNQTIYQDQQLFFDYGKNFFKDLTIPLVYLHRTDGPLHPHDIFISNQSFYHQKSLWIKEDIARQLDIEEGHILPTNLFVAVYENDVDKVNDIIENYQNKKLKPTKDSRDQFEFPSYYLQKKGDRYEICHIDKQQNITALMLACVKGNKDIILALISAGADLNRCSLHGGRNALLFLLLGEATPEVKLELTQKFIERGIELSAKDAAGLTVLDYAILNKQNQVKDFLFTHLKNNNLNIDDYVTTENKLKYLKWQPTFFNKPTYTNDSTFPRNLNTRRSDIK